MSGFTLAVVYGTKKGGRGGGRGGDVEMAASSSSAASAAAAAAASAASNPAGRCPSPSSEPADDEPARPPAWRYRFLVNRFARLVPTYWQGGAALRSNPRAGLTHHTFLHCGFNA